jgi:selenocysteine-specific elongation factor
VTTDFRTVVIGTAGHIDHGKSALVHALTGTDPDRLKEEKARGITIDLGFAHVVIDGVNFAFVDVPGHERFVKNMLAGIGGIDAVVLVVAADESVMPQTREHFEICRLLRVRSGLVVLSKADLVDAETLDLVRLEVRELVAGSFLEDAPMIPVSARDGSGLNDLRSALVRLSDNVPHRTAKGAARLPIDRVFSMKGFGTVVTGTMASGQVAVDADLAIVPGSRHVKVRGVQVHGARRGDARAGERAAVNVAGVDVDEITRGQNLATPGAFAETRVLDAVLDVLDSAKPIRQGMRVRFHQGTVEVMGRVSLIGPDAGPVTPGRRGYVRLRLEAPVVAARGDRYILRSYSPPATIAGGVILDPVPPRGRVRASSAVERLRALDFGANEADSRGATVRAAAALIGGAGASAFPLAALTWRAGADPGDVPSVVAELLEGGSAARAGDVLVAPEILERLKSVVLSTLATHHSAQPLSEGIPREELRMQLFRRGHPAVFARALEDLAAEGRVVLRDRIALAAHRVALSPEEERAREAIEAAFAKGGLTPPDASALADATGISTAVIDRVVKLLQRQKVLVRVDALLFHDAALKQLKSEIAAMKTAGFAKLDVASFKTRFGVTRKFAIPLLEYLDRERVTRRAGETRVVL